MNKLLCLVLLGSFVLYGEGYKGSTTASVTLTGGVLKARHVDNSNKKYKRKDCPVCKGKGWYISGDGIKKVDCGYCEPETKSDNTILPEAPAANISKPEQINTAPATQPAPSVPSQQPQRIFRHR